jgi:hypothetical protein
MRFIRAAIAIAIAAPLFAGLALDVLAANPSTTSPFPLTANRFLMDDRVDAHSSGDDEDAPDDENGASSEEGVFESQMFGFTLPYNADHWTPDRYQTDDGFEAARFAGPGRETFYVLTFSASGTPSEIADYWVDSVADHHDTEMELYEAPDTGETIDRRNRTEAMTLYSYEAGGETWLLYAHAVTSDDGKFVVLVVAESPEASYDLIKADVFPMLDHIEY